MAEESEVQILERHLGVVWDKVSLCREVMLESPGIKEDELLNSIIGFLEACSERMPDVIEAGANGMLPEALFSEVLRVNDAIAVTLEAEKTGVRTFNDGARPKQSSEVNLLDMDEAAAIPSKPTPAPSKVQASLLDMEDDDGGLDTSPRMRQSAPKAVAGATEDPFKTTSHNDIDLLLTEDVGNKKKETKRSDEDFDAFLDSIGANSSK